MPLAVDIPPVEPYHRAMSDSVEKLGIAQATARLRARILATESGAFLGNEETLLSLLGTSRATLRQIARILEREGLVEVRRGISGGYYASRPSLDTIETAVSGYLYTLDVQPGDATMIASVLWVETLRKAARAPSDDRHRLVDDFVARLARLRIDASFDEIMDYERAYRDAVFDLNSSRYVQLIFQINSKYANTQLEAYVAQRDPPAEFVREWRSSKYLELATLANGDPELAATAATRARNIWHSRFSFPERLE